MAESTEINFFLKDLMAQSNYLKPMDDFLFAQTYFEKVKSCNHIIGVDYSYILESNYNRRSFVNCLVEIFTGFNEKDELTTLDLFHMIETICPNFPRNIVMDASLAVEATSTDPTTKKFYFGELSTAVYLHIIYDEWLKLMEIFFKEENTLGIATSSRLKFQVLEFSTSFSLSFFQPPSDLVNIVVDSITLYNNTNDIKFDDFRRAFCSNNTIASELRRLILNASAI
jgi:hypothetical protein